MSGYPPDDRYDDRPDDRRPDARGAEQARRAVTVPATLLIVTGVLAALVALLSLVQLRSMPAQMDQAIADIDADPNMPADQKDLFKKVFTALKEHAESDLAPVQYIVAALIGVVIVIGGVKLLKLSGPTFPIIGSILAMIPCTSGCCCLLGLPAGIWALVVLSRPEVKAAMAANRPGSRPDPDDQYMR